MNPTPWHQIVRLKPELRSGELSLAEFAADLHEVVTGAGRRPIYEDPAKFFALTYPTHALRDLVKDIAARLAGQSAKAVRQLEMTYGGGKTHTLITLHHLFHQAESLPDLASVREFREHADHPFARAATAALCFDKIDVEKGIEGTRGPNGETRTLKHPWSVLAFQLAGTDGLRILHGDDLDEERDTPPAEPLLVKLIERQQRDGSATLILLDEVMMYARSRAIGGGDWLAHLRNFFQYLTQAAAKIDRAAIVASLLATEPGRQNDPLGKGILRNLADIFRRQSEEGVQPVQKEDVAEVLARRFFEPDSVRDRGAYKPHVIGIVKGIAKLDETTGKARKEAEKRFLDSFPFHPDLTDVFYSRWTQIEGFQRTRGILRTLATALRDAEPWDRSPIVGPAVLLAKPGAPTVSEAMRELAKPATMDSVEGKRTEWVPLLEAEFDKAREIQQEFRSLSAAREVEQAVVAVFLHSQPVGSKAHTPELLRLVGGSAPDAIELEKGLRRWRDTSWFLDDDDIGDDPAEFGGEQPLPRSWRLGNAPNLKQMHDEACRNRVTDAMVEDRLEAVIRKTKSLTNGASAAGARVHLLPKAPRDVPDDGEFRYVILGPGAVSASGKPSGAARAFLDHTTGPHRPRVYRNALVAAVPSREGLDAARARVRSLLGWEDVAGQLQRQAVDPLRAERLRRQIARAGREVPGVVRQAYGIVVTVDDANRVHAFKLQASGNPLFEEIKGDRKARIKDTPVNAEALVPGGPYDLWREGEESRFANQLAESFARYPHLPKVLRPNLVTDTVLAGVRQGLFVARQPRPDGSNRTWWREPVDPVAVEDKALEIVLPEKARLASLNPGLLAPGNLPDLWKPATDDAGQRLRVATLLEYFSGSRVATNSTRGLRRAGGNPRLRPRSRAGSRRHGGRKGSRLDNEPSRDVLEGGRPPRNAQPGGVTAPAAGSRRAPAPDGGNRPDRLVREPHKRSRPDPSPMPEEVFGGSLGNGPRRHRRRRQGAMARPRQGQRSD
ncbi:MAG: ATP-binding protein [Gemmatimonadetes bacterium]|nr:ATP-binding protein [Gemmatimonadota bacterium]